MPRPFLYFLRVIRLCKEFLLFLRQEKKLWLAPLILALLLLYEHMLVSPRDLSRLNAAFFTMIGVIAMVFLGFVATDLWLAARR